MSVRDLVSREDRHTGCSASGASVRVLKRFRRHITQDTLMVERWNKARDWDRARGTERERRGSEGQSEGQRGIGERRAMQSAWAWTLDMARSSTLTI